MLAVIYLTIFNLLPLILLRRAQKSDNSRSRFHYIIAVKKDVYNVLINIQLVHYLHYIQEVLSPVRHEV